MKQFKSESKRLLELMVNSIYTNREIFLRELISNASDAIDKLHFQSLTDPSVNTDFAINVSADGDTLSICDNGIGMDGEELERFLGTIAFSGTDEFKKSDSAKNETELIGKFGVGFYSAFMVADNVTVASRKYGSDKAYRWTSNGAEGYDITECLYAQNGTTVTLHLKPDDEDMKYSELTHAHKLKELVKKYSDFIRYPIYVDGEGPINSMTPIWKQPKANVTKEKRNEYFKQNFHESEDARLCISASVEGAVSYNALMFVPSHPRYDYYTKDYKRGLALYSNGVLIDEKCERLLPEYLGFIVGVVDSPDVSLNISRETLQQDRQLVTIANILEKKIIGEFEKFRDSDRDGYSKLFENFAKSIKYGAYDNYGAQADKLKDLLMFYSCNEKKLITLKEYCAAAKDGCIHYACGETVEKIAALPQLEGLQEKGADVLFFTDAVDEFITKFLQEYDGKKFVNISSYNDDKTAVVADDGANALLEALRIALKGKVKDVRPSLKLVKHPVCLTTDGEVSLEMERVFASMGTEIKAERVLEVNVEHAVCKRMIAAIESGEPIDNYAVTLYNEALILEGLKPTDDFTTALNALIVSAGATSSPNETTEKTKTKAKETAESAATDTAEKTAKTTAKKTGTKSSTAKTAKAKAEETAESAATDTTEKTAKTTAKKAKASAQAADTEAKKAKTKGETSANKGTKKTAKKDATTATQSDD